MQPKAYTKAGIIILVAAFLFDVGGSSYQVDSLNLNPTGTNLSSISHAELDLDLVVSVGNLPPSVDIHVIRVSKREFEIILSPEDPNSPYDLKRMTASIYRNKKMVDFCTIHYHQGEVADFHGQAEPCKLSSSEVILELSGLMQGAYSVLVTIEDETETTTTGADFNVY